MKQRRQNQHAMEDICTDSKSVFVYKLNRSLFIDFWYDVDFSMLISRKTTLSLVECNFNDFTAFSIGSSLKRSRKHHDELRTDLGHDMLRLRMFRQQESTTTGFIVILQHHELLEQGNFGPSHQR